MLPGKERCCLSGFVQLGVEQGTEAVTPRTRTRLKPIPSECADRVGGRATKAITESYRAHLSIAGELMGRSL